MPLSPQVTFSAVRSKVAVPLLLICMYYVLLPFLCFCTWFLFCYAILSALSNFATITLMSFGH